MNLIEARRRLAVLPTTLPPMPREIMPVIVGTPSDEPDGPKFPDGERRAAAVLILIYPDAAGQAHLVLTVRSAGGHRHAGQISLPGGAIEPAESAIDAALREAREEVGLDAEQAGLSVAGVLPQVDVRVSGFMVQPVLAWAERPPLLEPDGYEVESILLAPLAAFLPGAPVVMTTDERDGFTLRYGGYQIGEHLVWGATAGILSRLGVHLAGVSVDG